MNTRLKFRLYIIGVTFLCLFDSPASAQTTVSVGETIEGIKQIFQKKGSKNPSDTKGNAGKTIRGDWGTLGAGGELNVVPKWNDLYSPRNHVYTFEVTKDNVDLKMSIQSANHTEVRVFSEYGAEIGHVRDMFSYNTLKFPRSGKYYMIFHAKRYTRGTYMMQIEGLVSNIQEVKNSFWEQGGISFGEEGGGGSYDNIFSPRNHRFVFEPVQDEWYDINVESNGLPIDFVVVEPNGNIIQSKGDIPGLKYVVVKANLKGNYRIYVGSVKSGDRGNYKLEVTGNLKEKPVLVNHNFKTFKVSFNGTDKIHEYVIPAKTGANLEVLYRSTSVNSELRFSNAFNEAIHPYSRNNPTGQYRNEAYRIPADGNYKLRVEAEALKKGEYELLIWGNFEDIQSQHTQGEDKQKNLVSPSGTNTSSGFNDTESSEKRWEIEGQIKASRKNLDYSVFSIVSDDLETGERTAETTPDKNGKYTLRLIPGKQYSITVLSDGKYIASSENIDLTSYQGKANDKPLQLKTITLLSPEDVGEKLVLNNIFFETGSPVLLRKSYAELKRIAAFLKANPSVKVEIAGHTDGVGDDASNITLSQNRANAVLYYLQDQTNDFNRLEAKGYGKREPVASNSTPEGRQENRRVEFRILN